MAPTGGVTVTEAIVNLPERITSQIREDASGCWIWTGYINPDGYGRTYFDRRGWSTHRLLYTAHVGPIEPGMTIDHLCRVRSCCNPDHLEQVTSVVNTQRGGNAIKTKCRSGHEFTEENTYWYSGGKGRACKACKSDRARAQAAAKPKVPRKQRTHCKNGHPFDRVYASTSNPTGVAQYCSICHLERNRRAKARLRVWCAICKDAPGRRIKSDGFDDPFCPKCREICRLFKWDRNLIRRAIDYLDNPPGEGMSLPG